MTKKTLLAVFFISLFSFSEAQQNLQSKYFTGGSLAFSQNNTNDNGNVYKTTITNLSPTIGYFFSNKFAFGLQPNYSYGYSRQSPNSGYTLKNQTYGITPFLRYVKSFSDKFGFYMDLAVPYSYSVSTTTDNLVNNSGILIGNSTSETTGNSIGVKITPGIQWFIKDNLSLIGTLGALGYNYTQTVGSGITNNLNLSLSTSLSLGIYYYFGGIKKQE